MNKTEFIHFCRAQLNVFPTIKETETLVGPYSTRYEIVVEIPGVKVITSCREFSNKRIELSNEHYCYEKIIAKDKCWEEIIKEIILRGINSYKNHNETTSKKQ